MEPMGFDLDRERFPFLAGITDKIRALSVGGIHDRIGVMLDIERNAPFIYYKSCHTSDVPKNI